ncbi:DUF2478 domain-containing protein [Bradyrhizobium sp.]|uniref:DUF2478 domain-containing protein n=1 Tax=Bradyrhizobium sp. TaxID=376 RepID=UPI001E08240B|nr:DUF2478 domain-containing protein [Bradyrhizobium sp.]MBI5321737.1 DUF2478 domain-containing protein [Bradyrhizobium sp.]
MSVTQLVPNDERPSPQVWRVAAIVYPDNAYPGPAFDALVRLCRDRGMALAGVLQHQVCTAPDRRCDVVLEDLTTGYRTSIFEDRGPGAGGCRLDEGALAEATARIEGNLEGGADLLVLNKFGKAECSGGGLVDLMANAVDRGIPSVIGVPKSNLEAWRKFAGDFAVELSDDVNGVGQWLASLREPPAVGD